MLAADWRALVTAQDGDWPAYGRDPGGERFSPLDGIRRENVASLQVAWTFRTGDAYVPKDGRPTAFEATPLLCRRHALPEHAARPRHRARPGDRPATLGIRCQVAARQGLRRFRQPRRVHVAARQRAPHLHRDHRRAADRARRPTGKPVPGFGEQGIVDLRQGLRIAPTGSPTTRSPRRRPSSATPLSWDRPSPTAPRSRIRAAKCAASMRSPGKLKWTLGSRPAGSDGRRRAIRGRTAAPPALAAPTPGR